ncbi:CHAT domain-containing protein [uncultured Thiothrix sp.]|uniref:CHAT domain-containing protein n=1 Tax=uncultured Thiothrix sp. TaxID=223185 RepID=UPI002605EFB1|nr:CHAT domain-containing protein [uncultured Thiothrix sp.]
MLTEPFVIAPASNFLAQHPHLLSQSERLTKAYENKELVEEAHLKAVGEALWQALDLKDSLKQAKQAVGLNVLPIVISSNNASVMQLPWEVLYHPEFGFLGREAAFSLSRHDPDLKPALVVPKAEPLRILLFSSVPDDLGEQERLDIENEQASVQEALLEAELKGEVELHMPDDGRFETFKTELEKFKPQLVYLSGHGVFQHDLPHKRAFGSLLFEDGQGKGILISESKIAECFTNIPVQAVVLSACLSAKQHPNYPENGLSNALYRAGVPHVIGMRESIFDQTGIKFAETFLAKIADKQSVAIALQAARQAIVQPLKASVYREASSDPQRQALSFGQWCLPQLLSHDLHQAATDWAFTPTPKTRIPTKDLIGQISVPERFLGRRRELRLWQKRLATSQCNSLLITGAGGMGKTALASKLINELTNNGYHLFSFSLRPEHDWSEVELNIELAIVENDALKNQYELLQRELLNRPEWIKALLKLALKRYDNRLVLFFDNLESVQNLSSPHAITDEDLKLWLDAALVVSSQGLKVIATSRWQLPDWKGEHCALGRPVYGDYVAFVRQHALSLTGERLQTVYQVLGGNFRALIFFAEAVQGMSGQEESSFLTALYKAEAEAQTDMALAKLLSQCSESALQLLLALRAYPVAVPLVGVQKLAYRVELAESESLLKDLLAVSLVEQYHNANTEKLEYQIAPLVQTYLDQHYPALTQDLRQTAAKFLLWQLEHGLSRSWEYRLATHAALSAADLELEAQRFVLDYIVGTLSLAGLYENLLKEWLPAICQASDFKVQAQGLNLTGLQNYYLGEYTTALSCYERSLAIRQEIGDKSGEGTTLNNISQIFRVRGDYETALSYLQRSLAIQQEIGDIAGMSYTLFNMGHIYYQNKETEKAHNTWVAVYKIAKPINLAQVLHALEGLAKDLGSDEGLVFWEKPVGQSSQGTEISLSKIEPAHSGLISFLKRCTYQLCSLLHFRH